MRIPHYYLAGTRNSPVPCLHDSGCCIARGGVFDAYHSFPFICNLLLLLLQLLPHLNLKVPPITLPHRHPPFSFFLFPYLHRYRRRQLASPQRQSIHSFFLIPLQHLCASHACVHSFIYWTYSLIQPPFHILFFPRATLRIDALIHAHFQVYDAFLESWLARSTTTTTITTTIPVLLLVWLKRQRRERS